MSRHQFQHQFQCRLVHLVIGVMALISASASPARAIDDIRLSRIGAESTVEIELGCAMRYVNHSPAQNGAELRIQLSPGNDCLVALAGTWNDVRRPVGGQMASLFEIEFDRMNRDMATLTLRFDASVSFRVQQTANTYMLTVIVDTSTSVPSAPSATIPATAPGSARAVPDAVLTNKNRAPARRVPTPAPLIRNRFAIRLAVLGKSDDIDYKALNALRSQVIYTNEIAVGERRWAELRMGFFDTEAEAEQALAQLGSSFTTAWITVANPEEQAGARRRLFSWNDAQPVHSEAGPQVSGVAVTHLTPTMSAAQATSFLADAKAALLRRDYDESIRIYTRLLEEPSGGHRREAREILGVARQKNGQPEYAVAEYSAYLDEFPHGADARRVQQRLAALSAPTGRKLAETRVAKSPKSPSNWEFYGDASQYYLRGVDLAQDNDPEFVAQSALLSQAHVLASREGERFDIMGRASLGYLFDFVENGSGDQGLVSYAYVDITDKNTDVNARVGRQIRQSGGVLGRFDGAHASYRFRPNLTLNVTAGFPLDSPRFLADTDHYFYGASVDLDNIAGAWDFSVFANSQSVDGISDRKAVGAETQYHSSRLNLIGVLDFDAEYNIINTGLLTGIWRIGDRLTLHGRLRGGVAPFLTTRNAIIGQSVNTVRELFPFYTEGQIRRLARNRTAEERSGSAGLSAALTPRLQFKADFAYLEYSATVASGGVAAYPGTGPQYRYGGHLVGSGFFKPGHIFVSGYRHDETRDVDTDTIWIDVRYPLGERLRIQSRLGVSHRVADQDPAGDIEQWVANPMLRVLYTWKHKYRLEFELGGEWSNREFPAALAPPLTPDNVDESSQYYVQFGYSVDF